MVEDNPDDELLTLDALKSAGLDANGYEFQIAIARDGVEALEFLFQVEERRLLAGQPETLIDL